MKVTVEKYKEIRVLFLSGKSLREISKELDISRATAKKYSEGDAVPWIRKVPERKASVMTDDIVFSIEQYLTEDEKEGTKKQNHTARRIYNRLVEEKGFKGGESTVRQKVREIKESKHKAFIPLQFEPGEAMQVDWGEAVAYIAENKEKIYTFCARLCYSCKPIVLCYRHQNEESFLDAFVQIFKFLGGVPKRVIFDNAKVAVKEGFGAHAKKQEDYAKLSAHYGFDAVFCNPASGHEKGLVEGLVGWSRRNILVPIPRVESLEQLNKMLLTKCDAYESTQIAGKPESVGAMFQTEKAALRALPLYPFETARCQNVRVGATSTVRFQTNEYSVPTKHVGHLVGVKGYPERVDIYFKGELIAQHDRLFGKNQKSCRLIDYIELLGERGRAVLNALPVKQTLSAEAYDELKANIKNPEKVMEILRRAAGLPPLEPEPQKASPQIKDDPVSIKAVDLNDYDVLLSEGN